MVIVSSRHGRYRVRVTARFIKWKQRQGSQLPSPVQLLPNHCSNEGGLPTYTQRAVHLQKHELFNLNLVRVYLVKDV